jgi:hypothetical protein
MTTTQNSTVTTIQIRRAGKLPLSISYAFTDSDSWILPRTDLLQSLIDPAIKQWWDSLTASQKSALPVQEVNLSISARRLLTPPQE